MSAIRRKSASQRPETVEATRREPRREIHPPRPPFGRPELQELRLNAPIFAALGDATRLALLARLSGGSPSSIARLAHDSPLTRQAITKHLRVLETAGLIRSVRRGRENLFELKPGKLDDARRALDQISQQWDDALDRLKRFVER